MDTNANTNMNSNMDTNMDTNTNANTNANTNMNSNMDTNMDTNTNANTNMKTKEIICYDIETQDVPYDQTDERQSEVPSAASCCRTAIIFDWDDTLLSSSWLTSEGLHLNTPLEIPPHAVAQLQDLEKACIKLLSHAVELGEVSIVTNAEKGWVELSAQRFMPRVLPLLSRCRVISARSTFEVGYPDQPNEWKVQAFCAAITGSGSVRWGSAESEPKEDAINDTLFENVLSFGDSIHDRNAVRRITGALPRTWSKNIKFVARPTLIELKRQIEFINGCIDNIYDHSGDLDLMLTIRHE